MSTAGRLERAQVADLAPLVRRAVSLDAESLARFRRSDDRLAVLVRLPFGVLASRTVDEPGPPLDLTVSARHLLEWLDGTRAEPPAPRDLDWRAAIPPVDGWRRVGTVPDADVRPLVRAGALALKDAAVREGVPGAQPRAEVADALLDAVVLTVAAGPAGPGDRGPGSAGVPITLRTLAAITRLGFLPRESYVAVDVTGRWVRVAAAYGSVFVERAGLAISAR